MEWVWTLMIEKPRAVAGWSRAFFNAGWIVAVAGLYGQVAPRVTDLSATFGSKAAGKSPAALADLYPAIPTWWIPESALGFARCAVAAMLGLWLIVTAKRLSRQVR